MGQPALDADCTLDPFKVILVRSQCCAPTTSIQFQNLLSPRKETPSPPAVTPALSPAPDTHSPSSRLWMHLVWTPCPLGRVLAWLRGDRDQWRPGQGLEGWGAGEELISPSQPGPHPKPRCAGGLRGLKGQGKPSAGRRCCGSPLQASRKVQPGDSEPLPAALPKCQREQPSQHPRLSGLCSGL